MIYRFESCVLDTATQQLSRDGVPVHAEPQVLAVLEYLISRPDRVVSKIELLDEVWGDRFVSESALTSRIKLARKACGDNGRDQRIVKTVHGRGYRFVAELGAASGESQHARDSAASPTQRTASAVVGRDAELDVLDRALADTERGERRCVFICGGMGSGKSTLVAEMLERRDDLDHAMVAIGRCLQTRGAMEPYFCLLDALGQLARSAPDLVRDTLDRVAPTWLAQLPALIEPEMTEPLERRLLGSNAARMLREGADAFDALAAHRPLVLVLEDLHWADDCALDVLDLLLQRSSGGPLLLIGTARIGDGPARNLVGPAVATGRAIEIEMAPLGPDVMAALIRDRLGADVPADVAAIVHDRSEGVPLFAGEIVSSWVRRGQLIVEDGSVQVAASLDELAATIPESLPPLVERELGAIDPDGLAVLEACAAAGDAFEAAAVAAALGADLTDVERDLRTIARDHGLVGATGAASWPDGTMSAGYAFTHQLYRQVVYDRTSPGHRALLHARIGRRIADAYGDSADAPAVALANHFLQAGDLVGAVEQLRAAGEQAAARNAHEHAETFLIDALGHLEGLPSGPERDALELRVRTALGPTLVATRGWFDPSVSADYERALELCPDEACPEAAAARYGLATVSELRGEFGRTEALLLPLLDAETEGDLAMEAHELVACSTFHQGAFDRSLDNARMVLEHWDEDAYSVPMARIAEHPASSCNSWSSLASWALGYSDESLRQAERAVALGERNLYALSTAVQQRAMLHQIRNEPELCIEWAERCREVGREQSFPMRMIQADIYKGWAVGVSGSPGEGEALVAEGLARFRAAGATLNEAYYLGLHADTSLHGGDPVGALGLLDEALQQMVATTRSYFFETELHRLRARGLVALDAIDEAREALAESRRIATRQGSPAFALRTAIDRLELELAFGDPDPWTAMVEELLTIARGQQPTPDVLRATALLTSQP